MKVTVSKAHSFTGHRDCVYTLVPGDEPSCFFSGAGDGMVVAWDLCKPDEGALIARLEHSIYALHYHPASGLLVVGHNYDGIHFIDWRTKAERGSLQLTQAAIFDIQSVGSHLLVATGDGELIVVDSGTRTVMHRLKHASKSARCVAVNTLLGEVAVGYSDHYIRIFSLDNWQLKHAWQAHTNSVFTVRYTPDGRQLMSGSRDARLKTWDAMQSYIPVNEVVAHLYAINHLEFSPDAKHFVTCSMDKSIKVWDLAELKLLKVIDKGRHAGHGTSVNKLLWSPHENQVVSASDDRTISVWDIRIEE